MNTSKCLDLPGNSYNDGTQIEIWDCNGLPQQKWTYDPNMKTIYLASSRYAGRDASKCLDLRNGNPQSPDGTVVQLWDCNGQPNQQWDVYQFGQSQSAAAIVM